MSVIVKIIISLLWGHSNYVPRTPQTYLRHYSERMPTQHRVCCYGLTEGTEMKPGSWITWLER